MESDTVLESEKESQSIAQKKIKSKKGDNKKTGAKTAIK